MTYYTFTRDIFEGNAISLSEHGGIMRDFTFVDDAVEAIQKLIPLAPKGNPDWNAVESSNSESYAPYKIYNIGNRDPIGIDSFLSTIEKAAGKPALREYGPMKEWKMHRVCADPSGLEAAIGYKPKVGIEEGLERFVAWYKSYYKV
jgi:UDP-glucuronate 4-epimerase